MLEKMDVVAIQRQPGPWSIAGYIWAGALTKKRDHSCWQASLGSPTASLGLSNLCQIHKSQPRGGAGCGSEHPIQGPCAMRGTHFRSECSEARIPEPDLHYGAAWDAAMGGVQPCLPWKIRTVLLFPNPGAGEPQSHSTQSLRLLPQSRQPQEQLDQELARGGNSGQSLRMATARESTACMTWGPNPLSEPQFLIWT